MLRLKISYRTPNRIVSYLLDSSYTLAWAADAIEHVLADGVYDVLLANGDRLVLREAELGSMFLEQL